MGDASSMAIAETSLSLARLTGPSKGTVDVEYFRFDPLLSFD